MDEDQDFAAWMETKMNEVKGVVCLCHMPFSYCPRHTPSNAVLVEKEDEVA